MVIDEGGHWVRRVGGKRRRVRYVVMLTRWVCGDVVGGGVTVGGEVAG